MHTTHPPAHQRNCSKHRQRSAFTLVEIVVTLLILAVLATITVPTVQRVRENSVKRSAQTTLEAAARAGETLARADADASDVAIAAAIAAEFADTDTLTISVVDGADGDGLLNTVTVTYTSGSITASGSVRFTDGSATITPASIDDDGGPVTTSTTSTVPQFVPVVGATGPGGGTIYAVFETPFPCGPTLSQSCTYLEMAPTNWQQHPSVGGQPTGDPVLVWSGSTDLSIDGTRNDLGHGHKNSELVAANDTTGDHGATLARTYTGGGVTDWFLPSGDELNELCKYANRQTTGDVSVACTAILSLRPGFASAAYWSSTETAPNLAWTQSFGNGQQSNVTPKSEAHRIRPVRAG